MRTYRLVIACPDRVGIVAKVSNFLALYNGWITASTMGRMLTSGTGCGSTVMITAVLATRMSLLMVSANRYWPSAIPLEFMLT